MGDDRRPTYLETGDDGVERRIWRASSLGACERSLVAHALELPTAPVPAAIQRAYDAGNSAEDEIIGHVTEKGWKLLGPDDVRMAAHQWVESGGTGGLQVTVEIVVGKVAGVEQVIRCHPDGIVRKWKSRAAGKQGEWEWTDDPLHEERVVEAKFLRRGSPHTSVSKARSSRFYAWQTSVEMHATGLGLIMAVGWKVKDPDTGEEKVESVDVQTFDEPMYKLGQVKARVFKLARMVEDAMENGLGGVECDWAMYPCAFYESHDGQKVWIKAADREEGDGLELGEDGLTKLTALAGRVTKLRMMEERYKQQKQAASEELRVALEEAAGERGNTYRVGDFTVQWRYTPAKEAEEKVVQYKARAESETVIVKQGGGK